MSQRKLTYMKEIQGTVKSLEYLVLVLFAMKDADTFWQFIDSGQAL